MDESPIRVLDRTLKGKTHRGYFWVYYDPIGKQVLFDYREGGLSYTDRYMLRQEKALPVLESLESWLKKQIIAQDFRPKSTIGKAVGYALARWGKLVRYLGDGRYCTLSLSSTNILPRFLALFSCNFFLIMVYQNNRPKTKRSPAAFEDANRRPERKKKNHRNYSGRQYQVFFIALAPAIARGDSPTVWALRLPLLGVRTPAPC